MKATDAKLKEHQAGVWPINTGWTGCAHGIGSRIKSKFARAIIDLVLSRHVRRRTEANRPVFGILVVTYYMVGGTPP